MADAEFRIDLRKGEYDTRQCGRLTVFTHGNRRSLEVAILTVHDLGTNHNHIVEFLKHEDMVQIAKRFLWIHVLMPGHNANDPDLPTEFKFPSLQAIADELICVLDGVGVKNVVLFGEGAGANILARFAMTHNSRVYGAFLIHIVGNTDSVFSKGRHSVATKSSGRGWNQAMEDALVKHRFGKIKDTSPPNVKDSVQAYRNFLNTLNQKNCMEYIAAYNNRTSIKDRMGEIRCPVIFVTCTKSAYNSQVVELHYTMQKLLEKEPTRKLKTELIEFDGVANVIMEKPAKVAECFQYFLQGLGLGSSLINRRISANSPSSGSGSPMSSGTRIRSVSMADYDKPRGPTYYGHQASLGGEEPKP